MSQVKDGFGALASAHRRNRLDADVQTAFADSLDIDAGLRSGRESENRWDDLLGHAKSGQLVAFEPHSAKLEEVGRVIEKKKAALRQLEEHLRAGKPIAKRLWVASGEVQIPPPFDKFRIRLANAGIAFVGRRVLAKHLPRRFSPAFPPPPGLFRPPSP